MLAAVGDEQAIRPHRPGGLEIVDRVADVERVGRRDTEVVQVGPRPLGLAPGVDVAAPAELAEAGRQGHRVERLLQEPALVGGEHGMGGAAAGQVVDQLERPAVQAALRLARLIGRDELVRHRLELGLVDHDAHLAVDALHRELEDPRVVGWVDGRQSAPPEHPVERLAAQPGVVQQRPVPVPHEVAVVGQPEAHAPIRPSARPEARRRPPGSSSARRPRARPSRGRAPRARGGRPT